MAALQRLFFVANQKLPQTSGLFSKFLLKNTSNAIQNQGAVRLASHGHRMEVTASRWQWHKTKDWMHFYFLLGAIPGALIITYANVFIGPATLEPIPEGYVPKQWEYYKSPITRFIARYISPNIQMEYEKYLAKMVSAIEKKQLRALSHRVQNLIVERSDYKYWTYRRGSGKQVISIREKMDNEDPYVGYN